MNNLTDINKFLTKAFQQKCYLLDDSKSVYKLQFPDLVKVSEIEEFKKKAEKFLSQYDLELGESKMIFQETEKFFELQINKLPINKILEKVNLCSRDIKFHAALDDPMRLAMLFQKDINLHCRNINGETPLQIAEQKNDILLGKKLIDALLNNTPEIDKPDFCLQELSSYWDERLKQLDDKLLAQVIAEGAKAQTTEKMREHKVKKIINFFSTKDSTNLEANDKQLDKLSISHDLGK